jgi:hypothetical protein
LTFLQAPPSPSSYVPAVASECLMMPHPRHQWLQQCLMAQEDRQCSICCMIFGWNGFLPTPSWSLRRLSGKCYVFFCMMSDSSHHSSRSLGHSWWQDLRCELLGYNGEVQCKVFADTSLPFLLLVLRDVWPWLFCWTRPP